MQISYFIFENDNILIYVVSAITHNDWVNLSGLTSPE